MIEFITWIHAKWLYDSNPDALSSWKKETVTFHFSVKDRSRRNCHRILWIWVISLSSIRIIVKKFHEFRHESNAISSTPFTDRAFQRERASRHNLFTTWKAGGKAGGREDAKGINTNEGSCQRMQLCHSMDKTIERKSVSLLEAERFSLQTWRTIYISTSSLASPRHFPFFFFLRIYDLTGCSKAARYALEETDRFN